MTTFQCILLAFNFFVFGVLITASVMHHHFEKLERLHVRVGDIWEYVGHHLEDLDNFGFYRAEGTLGQLGAEERYANISWIMRRTDGNMMRLEPHLLTTRDNPWILAMRDGTPKRRPQDVRKSVNRYNALVRRELDQGRPS